MARARFASPITHVKKAAPPFLLVHGTADRTVNVKHADSFVAALKKKGATVVDFLRIEGAGHGVFGQHGRKVQPAMWAFFEKHLRQRAETPAAEPRRKKL